LVDCDEAKAGAANLPADAAEAQFLSKFKLTAQAAAGQGSKKQRECCKCGKAAWRCLEGLRDSLGPPGTIWGAWRCLEGLRDS
jgi:hypothetical protein